MYLQWLLVMRVLAGRRLLRITGLMTAGNILVGVGAFYYMTIVIGEGHGLRGDVYKLYGGPAEFMAVGVAANTILTVGLNAVAQAIKDERTQGTLGFWLLSRPSLLKLTLQASLGEFILAAVNGVITFFLLVLIFHVHFRANPLTFAVTLLICLAAVSGVGLWAAGLNIAGWKGQNPVIWAWGLTTNFIAGIYVPVEIFTDPILHTLTTVSPVTHALLAMRSAVLRDAPLTDPTLLYHLAYMAAFTAIILPVGIWQFNRGVDRALREGGLLAS
jgi:ABC-type multidrug transport system permease subunit